jgi:ribosomal protein S18 acetylase RimI-like enzyme
VIDDAREALRIEEAALRAWPALEQTTDDGWVVRFARGHTKRSNSVNPLHEPTTDVDEKIDACERAYAERGLPTLFRLTPFSKPASLDGRLDERGYARLDPTLVMTRAVSDEVISPPGRRARRVSVPEWLDAYERLGLLDARDMRTRRQIVERIDAEPIPLVVGPLERPSAVNLGVLDAGAVGLFSLFVSPERRRQGLGLTLVGEALRLAAKAGTSIAYLQVEEENVPARRLYERLGFETAYAYWYRIARSSPVD